jgi:hypothetical protein
VIRIRRLLAVAGAVVCGAAALPAAAGADPAPAGSIEVLATGLNNVRKVTWDPRLDAALVTEAGRAAAPCVGPTAGGCFSRTGSVYAWSPALGRGTRVVTGLPAVVVGTGGIAGISEVVPSGRSDVRAVFGLGALPAVRDAFGPAAAPLGQVVRAGLPGGVTLVADLAAYEQAHNPDGGVLDSNPYGIAAGPDGGTVVVDAAGNDVLRVGSDGTTTVLFSPPRIPLGAGSIEAVPDAIARGADGAYYVGELTGAPFPVGLARVWRVVPGQPATLVSGGFTNIIDLAVDRRGRVLVLEMAANGLLSGDPTGRLVRIEPDGTHTVLARAGLSYPGGVDVAPNGDVYLTNQIVGPDGSGQLLRIRGIG